MRFSYLFYEPIETVTELDERMRYLAGLKYQGIELSAFHPCGYSPQDALALARTHGLAIVSLLSGWSYSHEGLCLSSPDSSVRDRAVARLGDYVEAATVMNAVVVVGLMQGRQHDEPDSFIANDRIAECLARVAAIAAPLGVSIVLEPVNHLQVGFNNTAAEAAAMAARVASPAMSYMLDTFHLNVEERSILDTIRRHARAIRHFHLCETNGGRFGTGNLDFRRVLHALETSGYNHFLSVKDYRSGDWREAARAASQFLRQFGYF